MKILIATGIFEPEAGGPATYAPKLASQLTSADNDVTVVTYSQMPHYDFDAAYPFTLIRVVRGNRVLNRVKFFLTVLRAARACDLIYTLDWFAAGLPIALAAKILRKPYVVRVGGDYLWEQKYMESGQLPMTLSDFYERGIYRRTSYKIFFLLIRSVLTHAARVIFNSDKQRELYVRFYNLAEERSSTIYNAIPRSETVEIKRGLSNKEFIFWGRFIVMKNLDSLVRAFAKARVPDFTLTLIGEGPRKREIKSLARKLNLERRMTILPGMRLPDVLKRVKDCRALVLASWTDISPNQVYEAVAIGLPALVTKENYLSIRDELPATIDPKSVDDIAAKLEMLADDTTYRAFSDAFGAISFDHTWEDVTREHVALFERVLKKV